MPDKKNKIKMKIQAINDQTMCPGAVWKYRSKIKLNHSAEIVIQFETAVPFTIKEQNENENQTVLYFTDSDFFPALKVRKKNLVDWEKYVQENDIYFSHHDIGKIKYFDPLLGYPKNLPSVGSIWLDKQNRQLQVEYYIKPKNYPMRDYSVCCVVLNPQPAQVLTTKIIASSFGKALKQIKNKQEKDLENKKELEETSEFIMHL